MGQAANRPVPAASYRLILRRRILTSWERGERLLFEGAAGLTIRRVDPETAKTLLSELDEFDGDEQRETLNYLKKALNETRASQGARLIFPDDEQ